MDEVSLPNPTYDVDVEQGAPPDDTQSDGGSGGGGDDLIQARDVLAKTNKLLTLVGARSTKASLAHMAANILGDAWLIVLFVLYLNVESPHIRRLFAGCVVMVALSWPQVYGCLCKTVAGDTDAAAAWEILQDLYVTPRGAKALKKRAEAQAGQGLAWFVLALAPAVGFWYAGIFEVPWMPAPMFIGVFALGIMIGLPFQEACTATVIACTLIVRDQVEQAAERMQRQVKDNLLPPKDPDTPAIIWDYELEIAELYKLFGELIPMCEQATGGLVATYGTTLAFGGAVFTYVGASGELGSTPGSLILIGFSVTFWQAVLVYLYWPMQISSAATRVVEAANDLRVVVPIEQRSSLHEMVAFIKEQNSSQGPGFRLAGVVVTPAAFWRVAVTVVSLVVGAVANTI
jgi:hypothetical protein